MSLRCLTEKRAMGIIQSRAVRMIFPELGYSKALQVTEIPTLAYRRDLLSIAAKKDHKLANRLPPRSSHRRQLRNTRIFDTPVCH